VTLVDTNVLLDLVTDDRIWADWSIEQLERASVSGPLFINDVIYSELAVRYERIEDLDIFVDEAGLKLLPFPCSALFWRGRYSPGSVAPVALEQEFYPTFLSVATQRFKTFRS
jgi:predicted nucleic acid-binding protein